MIINDRNIKVWSTIGSRATFGLAALELAKSVENLMVLTCDVSTSAGLDRYRKAYPDKYLDLCKTIIIKADEYSIVSENAPPSIAAGVIYLVSHLCQIGIQKKDISNHCDISEVTINKCYKKLNKYKKLLITEEPVWINLIRGYGFTKKAVLDIAGKIKQHLPVAERPLEVSSFSPQLQMPSQQSYLAVTPVVSHAMLAKIQQLTTERKLNFALVEF